MVGEDFSTAAANSEKLQEVTYIFFGVGVVVALAGIGVLSVRCIRRRRFNERSASASPALASDRAPWAGGPGQISLEEHTKALARSRNKQKHNLQRESMQSLYRSFDGLPAKDHEQHQKKSSDRLVGVASLLNKSMDPGDDSSIMSFKYQTDGDKGLAAITSPAGRAVAAAGNAGRGPGVIERSSAFHGQNRRHLSYEQANYATSAFGHDDNRKASYLAAAVNNGSNRTASRIGSSEVRSVSDYSSSNGSPEQDDRTRLLARNATERSGRVVTVGGPRAPIHMATFGRHDHRQNSYNSAIGGGHHAHKSAGPEATPAFPPQIPPVSMLMQQQQQTPVAVSWEVPTVHEQLPYPQHRHNRHLRVGHPPTAFPARSTQGATLRFPPGF